MLDPRPEDIDIEDIAHHLALLCRFGGACDRFYSVAEHSIAVSELCGPADARWGLLHDATEAYLGDVTRPLKHTPAMAPYRALEARFQAAIAARFDLPPEIPASVSRADNRMVAVEAHDLMAPLDPEWDLCPREADGTPCPVGARPADLPPVRCWTPTVAETLFLDRFDDLFG